MLHKEKKGDDENIDEKHPNIKQNDKTNSEEDKKRKKSYFSLQASILGIWVASVVGETHLYTFKIVNISSFISRFVAFLVAFVVGYFKRTPAGAFLFYCYPPGTETFNVTQCSNMTDCFSTETLTQQVRICEDQTDFPFLYLALSVLLSGILSILAQYKFISLADYKNLFEASKSVCCIPCQAPIIHRSLVFTLIKNKSDEKAAKTLTEIFDDKTNQEEIANRPLEGSTAVMAAVENNKPECLSILLSNEARIVVTNKNEYPMNVAVNNGYINITKLLLENKAEIKGDLNDETYPLNVAMRNRNMEIASLLIQNGAENRKDSGGDSFLVHCVKTNNLEMIKLFFRHGGKFVPIDDEENLMDIATRGDNPEMTEYLMLPCESPRGVVHNVLDSFPVSVLTDTKLSDDQKKVAIENSLSYQYEDNISQSARALVQEWNQVHTDAQIEIRQRGMGENEVKAQLSDGSESISGFQTITGVRIKYNSLYIQSLQFLYGEKAGEIHKTGDKDDGAETEEIRVEAPITRIITKHYSREGDLLSLEVSYIITILSCCLYCQY